jgi:hypothetical protein
MSRKATTSPRPLFRFVSRNGDFHSTWRRMPREEDMPPRPGQRTAVRLGDNYGIEIRTQRESGGKAT